MSTTLLPGFADPVRDSQAVFRAVLDAMARPGRVHEIDAAFTPPVPLDVATAALLLTLVDAETPLWLDDRATAAKDWLAFQCGAATVAPSEATFAVSLGQPPLALLSNGCDETPESSATLVLQVAALGAGERFNLTGPGLPGPSLFAVDGLPTGFLTFWPRNARLFPRGIDVVLCAGRRLAALPRTVQMEAA